MINNHLYTVLVTTMRVRLELLNLTAGHSEVFFAFAIGGGFYFALFLSYCFYRYLTSADFRFLSYISLGRGLFSMTRTKIELFTTMFPSALSVIRLPLGSLMPSDAY